MNQMTGLVEFKVGSGIDNVESFSAGTLYLDTSVNEIWFDDPLGQIESHQKVIDTSTLIYNIDNSIDDPFEEEPDQLNFEFTSVNPKIININ